MKPRKKPLRSPERRPRRTFGFGAAATLLGLAIVGVSTGGTPSLFGGDRAPADGSDLGVFFCIVGVLAMIYAIHTFGRLGPEGA